MKLSNYLQEMCPICINTQIQVYTECNHGYCINCLCRLNKCALCRKKLQRKILCDEIQKKNNRYVNSNHEATARSMGLNRDGTPIVRIYLPILFPDYVIRSSY